MSLEVWKEYCLQTEHATIGGGEPTLHPLFWQFLGHALATCEYVWMATNGSQTETALALAMLDQKLECFGCELSVDQWHDPIDERVYAAFDRSRWRNVGEKIEVDGHRRYRRKQSPIKAGRCDWGRDECPCTGPQLFPDGRVRYCGCEGSPWLGTIFDSMWPGFECWREGKDDAKEVARLVEEAGLAL